MGYGNCEKGYRVYALQSKKIVLSRSVVFDEDKCLNWEGEQQKIVISQPLFQGMEKVGKANEEEKN